MSIFRKLLHSSHLTYYNTNGMIASWPAGPSGLLAQLINKAQDVLDDLLTHTLDGYRIDCDSWPIPKIPNIRPDVAGIVVCLLLLLFVAS